MERPRPRHAFTLVELLVVLLIVFLISAVTLPAIITATSHRELSEAARILQASLVQARDTAIRFNAPRGVRFLPDPTYDNTPGVVAYNRMVPLEPGPEYSNGMVTVWPQAFGPDSTGAMAGQPWLNPVATYPSNGSTIGGGGSGTYPVGPQGTAANSTGGQVLVLEQAPFQANDASNFVTAPTSWYWNIRVGDKLKIGNSGAMYTVVGPCTVNPISGSGNPELFVNVGQPGDVTNMLTRTYTDPAGNAGTAIPVEFLYLVNGVDDDADGYTDEGWDGVDNNNGFVYNSIIDDLGAASATATVPTEWENEKWLGTQAKFGGVIPQQATYNTVTGSNQFSLPSPTPYTIYRRPVPAQSARETMLPKNVVIDATTYGSTNERSLLPTFDPLSRFTDLLLLPSGQVVPTTVYSSPTSFTLEDSFYHFWLAERQDVHAPGELWSANGGVNPNPNPINSGAKMFVLPLPQDAYQYSNGTPILNTQPGISLKGEWGLVTLFSRTGAITYTQPGVASPAPIGGAPTKLSDTQAAEFNVYDTRAPFYSARMGQSEAK